MGTSAPFDLQENTMASLLEQLRQITVVVADTGDIQAIEQFTPEMPRPTLH
jgi:hypothetical protein